MGISDEIKQKLDVVEIVGEYIKLAKAGRNYKANCPFHGEKTPSFMVSPERQIWHCFGCGEGGDIFKFVMMMEGIEFGDALRILAKRAGVILKRQDPQIQSQKKRIYEINELAAKFFAWQLEKSPAGQKAKKYLLDRGMEEQTIKDWFKQSGTLQETYRLYAQELDLIHQETVDIVRKAGVRVREQNFRLANEMLVALMGSQQDNVKLAAIKELLDRVEGHPKDRIELSKINFKDMEPGDRWEFIPYEMQLALARNQYPDAKAAIIKKWLADGETK